jgi:ligand-binding sensor protein
MSSSIAYCPLVPAIQTTSRIGGLNRTRCISGSGNSHIKRPFSAKATVAECAKTPENPHLVPRSRGILSETRHRAWRSAEGGGAVAKAHPCAESLANAVQGNTADNNVSILAPAKDRSESQMSSDSTSEQPLQQEQAIKGDLGILAVEQADFGSLELAEIVDVKLLHSLIDDFHAIVNIPMGIIDMKGKMLVGVGWQDICRTFHRVHPETYKNCIESDTRLTAGVAPGEFKLYKCKNNMWAIATPLIVCNQHVGNIFSGQFVFDDEPPDVEFFRTQAQRYGFNEEQYLAALAAVPRLSREHVNTCMTFLTTLVR